MAFYDDIPLDAGNDPYAPWMGADAQMPQVPPPPQPYIAPGLMDQMGAYLTAQPDDHLADPRVMPSGPAMTPIAAPTRMAYEPAQKMPQQGMFGNWLDNLATSLATQPLQAPNNFGGGLLSGFAHGFSGARLKNMGEREKLQKAMDDFAAKRNAANLQATEDARKARQKRLDDLRADIEKRRRDRDDLIFKTVLEASVKPNSDGTFTLTASEAKAMGQGYEANQTVPKEIKVEALARTRPEKAGGGKSSGVAGPELSDYTTLLTKVQGDNDIQKFQVVRDAWAAMQKAPVSGAGDISLIYSFMRINDPGSTVREGEFATAENAGGVPAQIRNLYNKVVRGQRLEVSVRNDFMATAQAIYRARLPQVARATSQYRALANQYGMNPELVVRDYSTDDPNYTPLFDPKNNKGGTGKNVNVRYKGDDRVFSIPSSRLEEALKQGNIEEVR